MLSMKRMWLVSVILICFSQIGLCQIKHFDLVVYGGTSAGISAAIQASRMGKTVVLIEPTSRIGGLTTGGLGQTDIGNKQAIGGIAREFYQNIKKYYQHPGNWKWQKPENYKDGGQTRTDNGEDAMWTFEPSAALKVYLRMLEPEKNITLVYNQRLGRKNGVTKKRGQITSIAMEGGEIYAGKMFIDATYEGDLMAAARVSYTVGRESNKKYGETLNGVHTADTARSMTNRLGRNSINHNFVRGVDPYIEKGIPKGGLLPFINPRGPGKEGSGNRGVQAYCFRMCLTDHPENRIPFEKPAGYNFFRIVMVSLSSERTINIFPRGSSVVLLISSGQIALSRVGYPAIIETSRVSTQYGTLTI